MTSLFFFRLKINAVFPQVFLWIHIDNHIDLFCYFLYILKVYEYREEILNK